MAHKPRRTSPRRRKPYLRSEVNLANITQTMAIIRLTRQHLCPGLTTQLLLVAQVLHWAVLSVWLLLLAIPTPHTKATARRHVAVMLRLVRPTRLWLTTR